MTNLISVCSANINHEKAVRNTINALLSFAEPIPEDPEDISDILKHIDTCNAQTVIGAAGGTIHWPDVFCPTITHCVLCNQELASPTHPPGSNGKCYLLTKVQLCPVTAKIRRCTNQHCMARYGYSIHGQKVIVLHRYLTRVCIYH